MKMETETAEAKYTAENLVFMVEVSNLPLNDPVLGCTDRRLQKIFGDYGMALIKALHIKSSCSAPTAPKARKATEG